MSLKPLHLKNIDLELQVPHNFEYHEEGFASKIDLYDRLYQKYYHRRLQYREIQDLTMTTELGLCLEFMEETSKGILWHIHTSVDERLKDLYPLSRFVKGHEETEVLQPKVLNAFDALLTVLNSTGASLPTLNGAERETVCHLGGLLALRRKEIAPDKRLDLWQEFLGQAKAEFKGYDELLPAMTLYYPNIDLRLL